MVPLIENYNPAWPTWFETLRAFLEPALAGLPHRIEHVGSTAVPGLAAKPIIDLDIIIAEGQFAPVKERLQQIGYVHQGDLRIPGREAFDLAKIPLRQTLPAHHPYVGSAEAASIQDHLLFRDFMRASPDWVRRLSRLKLQWCEQHGHDRRRYIDGKAALMGEIMDRARARLR